MRLHRFVPLLAAIAGVFLPGHALAQSVIDTEAALVAAFATGGDYVLAAGTIEVREPLVVAVDLRIVGAGRIESQLHLAAGLVGLRVHEGAVVRLASLSLVHAADGGGDLVHVHDATLALHDADLTFAAFASVPDGAKRFGYGSGLVLTGVAHAMVAEVVFGGHDLSAIEAYDRATLSVRDSVFVDNGSGLFATDMTRTTIVNALFTDHSANALAARGQAVVDVSRTSFVAAGRVDADFGRHFDAVRVGDEAVVAIERSVFRDHPRFALSLFGSARVTSNGNLYEANGGIYEGLDLAFGAILVEDAGHLTVRGDVVRGNAGGALETSGDARVVVVDASYEGNGSWAPIYVVGRSALTLTGSRYVGNEGAIFVAEGARATLRDNEIADNGEASVWAEGSAKLELEGNTIRGSAEDGVRLGQEARARLIENTIAGNRSGVVLYEQSHAHIENNEVVANLRAGIAFLESSGGAAIGNRIGGHEVGVVVATTAEVEVVGNAFDENGDDVRRE
jgi:hypothetical protein